MLSFLDKTFCPYWRTCAKGTQCDRALTSEIEQRVKDAGGFKLPIAVFADKPECHKEINYAS